MLKEDLAQEIEKLLQKRLDRLKNRKHVLFPWLRLKWLARKYKKAKELLG